MTSPRPTRRRLRSVAGPAALALLFVLAGCGGDDDPELTDESSSIDGDATGTTTETPAADEGTETGTEGGTGTDGTGTDGAATGDDAAEDPAAEDPAAAGETTEGETNGGDSGDPAPGGGDGVAPTPAPVSGTPAFTADSKLTTVGLDEIFFGDPVDVAAEKVGTEWIGLPEPGNVPQCYTVQPAGGPQGTVLTVVDGRIERVDIVTPAITTRSGYGAGSTEAEILEAFDELIEVTPIDGGNELVFVPTDEVDRDFRIIWTTDGTTVTAMRAGRVPVVFPAAPCG